LDETSSQTAAQAKYWLQFKYPKKTKITAVVQGEDTNNQLGYVLLYLKI
jgi:hypothetical protein